MRSFGRTVEASDPSSSELTSSLSSASSTSSSEHSARSRARDSWAIGEEEMKEEEKGERAMEPCLVAGLIGLGFDIVKTVTATAIARFALGTEDKNIKRRGNPIAHVTRN